MKRHPSGRLRIGSAVMILFLLNSTAVASAYELTFGISAAPAVERNQGEIEWHVGYLLETSWATASGIRISLGLRGDFELSAISMRSKVQLPVSPSAGIAVGVDIGWIGLRESVSFLAAAHLDLNLQSVRLDPFRFRVDLTLLLAEAVARNNEGLLGMYLGFPRSGAVSLSGQATPSWALTEKIGLSFVSVDTTQLIDPIGVVGDTLLFLPEFATLVSYTPAMSADPAMSLPGASPRAADVSP